jgi:hypothetical protein
VVAKSNLRGGLVVAAGLVVGIVMLSHIHPSHRTSAETVSRSTTTVQRIAPVTTAPPAAAPHDPASVSVVVLNGVDVTKPIAGTAAKALSTAGYANSTAKDATTTVSSSVVYFQPGFNDDAVSIAAALGLPASSAQPLSSPPPAALGTTVDAYVTVLIGPDAPVAGA